MTPSESVSIERECSRLALAFGLHVDMGEPERCAALFAETGTFERAGTVLRGRAAIVQALRGRAPGLRTRHHCLAPFIEVLDCENARGITYYTTYRHEAPDAIEGAAPLTGPDVIGEFHDTFVMTKDGWRIASRRSVPAFKRAAT